MDQDMSSSAFFSLHYSATAAKRLLWILLAAEVYIFTRIIAPDIRLGPIRRLLDVDRESSIPTWYSATQLFAVAVVLWNHAQKVGDLRLFFAVVGCGFLFLSADEAAGVHDSLYRAVKDRKYAFFVGREYLAWMVPYTIVGFVGLAIGYQSIIFIARRFSLEAAWIVLGAVLFVGGAVWIEIATHFLHAIAEDERFYLAVAAEEFCEMVGVSVMFYGFLLLGIRLRPDILEDANPHLGSRNRKLE
jgi:hypothetical protein